MARSTRNKLFRYRMGTFAFLLVGTLVMIFPFVWMLLSAFKTKADVYAYPPRWIPTVWSFGNFEKVFQMIPFLRYYANSLYTSLATTALQVVLSVTAAYSLTKLRFPGQRILATVLQSSMYVPLVVTMIPLYLLAASLGWVNTYRGIILPQVETAFTTMLLISFFSTIPDDLIDSAHLDGCGAIRVMTNVVIPNSLGAIATAALFCFLGNWKSYLWPLLITSKTDFRTLPIGMKYLVMESSSEYQVMMAAALMAILPVLVVFVLCEKQLVRSITLTGMKN